MPKITRNMRISNLPICNMKVAELRTLAISKNINIKNQDNKLKKKCELITELITTPDEYIKLEEALPTERVREYPIISRKKKVEDESEDEDIHIFKNKLEDLIDNEKSVSFGNDEVIEFIPNELNKKLKKYKPGKQTKRQLTEEEIINFKPTGSIKDPCKRLLKKWNKMDNNQLKEEIIRYDKKNKTIRDAPIKGSNEELINELLRIKRCDEYIKPNATQNVIGLID